MSRPHDPWHADDAVVARGSAMGLEAVLACRAAETERCSRSPVIAVLSRTY